MKLINIAKKALSKSSETWSSDTRTYIHTTSDGDSPNSLQEFVVTYNEGGIKSSKKRQNKG